jgi:hypothetical protein
VLKVELEIPTGDERAPDTLTWHAFRDEMGGTAAGVRFVDMSRV